MASKARGIRKFLAFRRVARRHTFPIVFSLLAIATMMAWVYFLGLVGYRAVEWTLS
jgi:hypothetical protein